MEQKIKRETAKYVEAIDIKNSNYIKQEGWNPNYLDCEYGRVSRINIIGTVITKEPQKIVIDDSTASIEIRSFEEIKADDVKVGDNINIIGRPREFNDEIYILPEIVRKINDENFIEYRKKELKLRTKVKDIEKKTNTKSQIPIPDITDEKEKGISQTDTTESKIEEEVVKANQDETVGDYKSLINKIEEMDSGDGVYVDDIVSNVKITDCEQKIKKLLENGDIFEVKAGKVKVL